MKALVVFHSQYGNTRLVAEGIGSVLQAAASVRILGIERLAVTDLSGLDLLVMGTPTHKMNLPQVVRRMLAGLPRGILRGTRVAAFDTSYKMSDLLARFTAAKRLGQKLRKLGGRGIVSPETFHVAAREGPLSDGEIERAKEWATSILRRLGMEGR